MEGVSAVSSGSEPQPETGADPGAPGRTRTCDPLLRRQRFGGVLMLVKEHFRLRLGHRSRVHPAAVHCSSPSMIAANAAGE
jgi:hypothetical protein